MLVLKELKSANENKVWNPFGLKNGAVDLHSWKCVDLLESFLFCMCRERKYRAQTRINQGGATTELLLPGLVVIESKHQRRYYLTN